MKIKRSHTLKLTAVILTAFLMVTCQSTAAFATGEAGAGEPETYAEEPPAAEVPAINLAQEVRSSMAPVIEHYVQQAKIANADQKEVPVLMFHHISEIEGTSLRADTFRRFMSELKNAGYTTVFYDELITYVDGRGDLLPDKPIVISFDDGYLSNYEFAFPILKELNMKAEISVIGKTVGLDKNPDTGTSIIPHFTWEQAREMYESGLVRIRSHSFNLHSHDSADHVDRLGALRKDGETLEEYDATLLEDNKIMANLIQQYLGYENTVFTYPYGSYTARTERLLAEPIRVTVTTNIGTNYIKIGDSSSLRLLNRIPCDTNSDMNIVDIIDSYVD